MTTQKQHRQQLANHLENYGVSAYAAHRIAHNTTMHCNYDAMTSTYIEFNGTRLYRPGWTTQQHWDNENGHTATLSADQDHKFTSTTLKNMARDLLALALILEKWECLH